MAQQFNGIVYTVTYLRELAERARITLDSNYKIDSDGYAVGAKYYILISRKTKKVLRTGTAKDIGQTLENIIECMGN